MPVVVRARDYDQDFYAAIGWSEGDDLKQQARKASETLYGE
jgi:hypothetical protein